MAEGFLSNSDESELARLIRRAIGAGDYEVVRVAYPQFERTNGIKVAYYPSTLQEFEDLKKAPADVLAKLGLAQWENGHWLYPGEWYASIPDGMEVVDINGETEQFQRGITDNDMRFGCLAYGFVRDEGSSGPSSKERVSRGE